MSRQMLITGGAGFIGSHLADELLSLGYRVRVLDNLCSQVHGPRKKVPDYLNPGVEFVCGDVRNPADVRRALEDVKLSFTSLLPWAWAKACIRLRNTRP